MSDRTESLLAELVELHRRQLANQESAIDVQRQSVELQRQGAERQRAAVERQWRFVRVLFVLLLVVFAMMILPNAVAWARWLSYRMAH